MSKYLVSGATGQAGKYLIEFLVNKGESVCGLVRRTSNISTDRIKHLLDKIDIIPGDLEDEYSLISALEKYQPDYVINLAAQSLVPVSWDIPVSTGNINGLGVVRFLSAVKKVNLKIRFLQMSTSELYGTTPPPQSETTPFHPRSPYACSKAYAFYSTINFRESYNMFASNAICFNFESPERGHQFVTKKITDGVVKIKRSEAKELKLGNLEARRDWNHVSDIVNAIDLIINHTEADDFVVASGESHSVREFAQLCFEFVGLNYLDYVKVDPTLIRPAEVPELRGDASKIKRMLGWESKVKFYDLVNMMMETELTLNS